MLYLKLQLLSLMFTLTGPWASGFFMKRESWNPSSRRPPTIQKSSILEFLARLQRTRFNDVIKNKEEEKQVKHEKQCMWQGQICNPWEDRCCAGMECLSRIQSYCLQGLEKCYCMRKNPVDDF